MDGSIIMFAPLGDVVHYSSILAFGVIIWLRLNYVVDS